MREEYDTSSWNAGYQAMESMTFVSFHLGHIVMMLFLKLQILRKAGYFSTFVCISQAYHVNFFLLQLFGYIGYKNTRSSLQRLLNFRYQKPNQMADGNLNPEAGNGN